MNAGRLAVFDLDGTITRHDTLLPFIFGYLWRHPWRLPRLLAVLRALAAWACRRADRGELKGALIRAALGGLLEAQLASWRERFIAGLLRRGLYAEALLQLAQQRAVGAHLVLLSASPDLYVKEIGRLLGFDETICTELRWCDDGQLDGRLRSPNRRGEEKARCVARLLATRSYSESIAYGNSSADLAHMALTTTGVWVNGRSNAPHPPHVRIERWQHTGSI
ncbi:MAG TPA: HAD-IB family hydrolase [Steroidobacteraceae bacterium]|nr:HAD-IB family hydrolase [Steroidobacteraceae bacterium]